MTSTRFFLFIFFLFPAFFSHSFLECSSLPPEWALLRAYKNVQPKKILFINPWYVGGGMGTSLLSLINTFPDPNVEIELCVQRKGGHIFSPILRKKVSFVEFSEVFSKSYDTVICYAQWMLPHVWVDTIQAKKRVLWIHGDTSTGKWVAHLKKEKLLTKKIDAFVCVSDTAAASFRQAFPKYADRTHTIYNVIDNEKIKRESLEPQTDMVRKDSLPIVLTVSRLAKGKGLEASIEAHALLEQAGVHFTWYVVGEGTRRPVLEELIKQHHLEGKFILLGFKKNPYSYMKDADICALFSEAEGFCLVITEAKILQKPIIASNFSTIYEQIETNRNGLIVENTIPAICQGLQELLLDPVKRARFSSALKRFSFDNSRSLAKLQEVLLSLPEGK